METYVATIYARPESVDRVTDLYRERVRGIQNASGCLGVELLRARPGAMLQAVMANRAAEASSHSDEGQETGGHDSGGHEESAPDGIMFVLIERWDSIEARMAAQDRSPAAQQWMKNLIPLVLPEHSHEFYDTVPV